CGIAGHHCVIAPLVQLNIRQAQNIAARSHGVRSVKPPLICDWRSARRGVLKCNAAAYHGRLVAWLYRERRWNQNSQLSHTAGGRPKSVGYDHVISAAVGGRGGRNQEAIAGLSRKDRGI